MDNRRHKIRRLCSGTGHFYSLLHRRNHSRVYMIPEIAAQGSTCHYGKILPYTHKNKAIY